MKTVDNPEARVWRAATPIPVAENEVNEYLTCMPGRPNALKLRYEYPAVGVR